MDVRLIRFGDYGSQEIPINVLELVIGRSPECLLRLDHGKVSYRHCRIFRAGPRVLVEDLGSSMGTAVNQTVLYPTHPPVELHDGDHLWIGPEYFRVAIGPEANPQSSPGEHRPRPEIKRDAEGHPDLPPNPLAKGDIKATQAQLATQILDRLNAKGATDEEPRDQPDESGSKEKERKDRSAPPKKHSKIDVSEEQGVSVARILPKVVVADDDIRVIGQELGELIDSGQNRITLNFGNVERLSSQVIGEVMHVFRRCKEDGGMLKICKVNPQVAAIFAMTNLERHIEVFLDERPALDSHWPKAVRQVPKAQPDQGRPAAPPPAPEPMTKRVRLVVEVGRAKGKVIELRTPKFAIGRDERCQLRPNDNSVSRLHSLIEQRGGKVTIRDLGSTSGTILNDRTLLGQSSEVAHGDTLQIGNLAFHFEIEDQVAQPSPKVENPNDDAVAWLTEGQETDANESTTILQSPFNQPAPPAPPPPPPVHVPPALRHHPGDDPLAKLRHIKYETVAGIGVVTILVIDLSNEHDIDTVRAEFQTLLDQPLPRHLILRFEHVRSISRGAVVMLLARVQQFQKSHGTMRMCRVTAPVMSFLEQTQLPALIEIYATMHEAVKTPWEPEPSHHENAR